MTIYFDMDGTIADLYAVEDWLKDLRSSNVRPYVEAKPMLNMRVLARRLNGLQKKGYKLGIVSWGSKQADESYLKAIAEAKGKWLATHLKSVNWDEVKVVEYGKPKSQVVNDNGILFDDEEPNRKEWKGLSYDVKNILEILGEL